ncbi:TPA: dUTP pyrophosphatase [Staphylococcus aureus]|nr:dUTP pyrophosphatase [Staphylococcus aureus]HDR0183965.1 dUTP pyrophosphatase [Staphylococcus aureus]
MTNTLQVKLLSKNARMPERNHKTDAGYDIFSAETVVLEPQEKAVIKTDVAVSIPEGYVGLLTSRSGVSSKTYLVIETGKIDAGYHGNMKINIKNDHEDNGAETIFKRDLKDKIIIEDERHLYKQGTYVINKGERLAQLLIIPIATPMLEEVKEFSNKTIRGTNGFGSTGF